MNRTRSRIRSFITRTRLRRSSGGWLFDLFLLFGYEYGRCIANCESYLFFGFPVYVLRYGHFNPTAFDVLPLGRHDRTIWWGSRQRLSVTPKKRDRKLMMDITQLLFRFDMVFVFFFGSTGALFFTLNLPWGIVVGFDVYSWFTQIINKTLSLSSRQLKFQFALRNEWWINES